MDFLLYAADEKATDSYIYMFNPVMSLNAAFKQKENSPDSRHDNIFTSMNPFKQAFFFGKKKNLECLRIVMGNIRSDRQIRDI